MITFENGLYVRIEELGNGPHPRPLDSGFNVETAYRVLGMHSPSETAEAYLILSNDRDEIWFISNRHLRTVGLSDSSLMRVPLQRMLIETAPPTLPTHSNDRDMRLA